MSTQCNHPIRGHFRKVPVWEEIMPTFGICIDRALRDQAVDFLPVLKRGDSLGHAVAWFESGN